MHGGSITGQPGLRLITRHRVRRAAAILSATAVTCGIALAGAAPARAAGATTITVTGFTDNTDACSGSSPTVSCPSLRSAVTYANGNEQSGPFTVNLAAGHYSLTLGPGQENGGPLAVQDSTVLTISGPGSASTVVEASALRSTTLSVEDGGTAAIQGVTIDGGSGPVSAGVIDNFGDLTISGSTISGGMDEGAGGGGIYNEFHGTLHIQSGTVLTGNVATSGGSGTGGALHNAGTADVTGATISGNSSGGSGAGIFNGTDAQLGLTDTTVSGNAAGGNGGGIYNDGTLTVTGGQVSGNQADDSTGGGVYNDSHGSLTITGATVSGNSADQGGGVYNVALLDGTTGATVSGSTISGNGTSSNGAGVANTGDLTVTGSTIAGNSAGGKGGGVYNSGTLTMLNSTLARNTIQPEAGATALFNDTEGTANLSFDTLADNPGATGTSTLFNNGTAHVLSSILAYAPGRQCAGSAIDDAGSNVFGDSTCDSEAQVIADPHLLPLSQNGTSVPETMAIFSTDASPSKALGTSTGTCKDLGGQTVTSDEVGGNRRPRAGGEGDLCDAGAFQLQSDTSQVTSGSASGATVTLTVVDEGLNPIYTDGTGSCSVTGGSGTCTTLRAAVQYADDHTGTTVAVELASGEYTLNPLADSAFGALRVTGGEGNGANLTIVGPGADQTVIEGGGVLADDLLSIDSGATVVLRGVTLDGGTGGDHDGTGAGDVFNGGTLTVTNATIAGGSATDAGNGQGGGIQNASGGSLTLGAGALLDGNIGAFDGGPGGGLANAGTTNLQGAVVSDNNASGDGGGIYNTGSLTLTGGRIIGNSTPSGTCGGGLANEVAGGVSATGSTFVGNTAPGEGCGGSVYNDAGNGGQNPTGIRVPLVAPRVEAAGMRMDGVVISGSSANIGHGGGIYNDSAGDLTLSGSTLSGNSAESEGGGIFNQGSLEVDHSTLSGNSAVDNDGGGVFNGGGGHLDMVNSTLTANSTAGTDETDATAFYNDAGTASLSFDTLVGNAGNFNAATLYTGRTVQLPMFSNILAYGTGTQCLVDETPLDGGGNVVGDTTCRLAGGEQNLDPQLLPLQASGGLLQVMPLIPGSPAVNTTTTCTDAGDHTVTDDENGQTRPSTVNGATGCDAGAFQLAGQAPPPPSSPAGPTPPTVTAVSPAFGVPAGGNSVAITGTAFSTVGGGTVFHFGANTATGVSCSSSTSCSVTAPAGALGPVDVTATVSGLTSATNPGDVYTYQDTGGTSGGSSTVCSANQNARFVCQAYLDLQGRAVDPQGVLTWSNGLIAGTLTRPDVVLGIDESIEYRLDLIQTWFHSYLNRVADPGALTNFLFALKSGLTEEQVQSLILGSPEYLAHSGGTNSGFLSALYQEVLNRPLDPTGSAMWSAALAHLSRQQVALFLLTSPEHEIQLVSNWYERFLHRGADLASLLAWGNLMSHGTSDEVVISGIVGSAEYFSHV